MLHEAFLNRPKECGNTVAFSGNLCVGPLSKHRGDGDERGMPGDSFTVSSPNGARESLATFALSSSAGAVAAERGAGAPARSDRPAGFDADSPRS
ncbi:non-ribosomal peptide synthetase modules [Microbacterium testaceum StLB037]|uniref:Non-ribosomal peptide synthetase modules n=1 Tax=Microbacterium testaceum (strain StLB037) TaxID=979556 RepID=E8N7C1_MICTS|nr:non-ribosomal peptide synthetase modules [Microbacterium testaceum StLB037]